MNLFGRVALVTGGGRGIGAAISHALAAAGAAVAVNYVSNADAARDTAVAITDTGGRAATVQGDVTVNDDVVRMVAETESELGPVDILVANAGIGIRQTIEETTEDDRRRLQPCSAGEPDLGIPVFPGRGCRHARAPLGPSDLHHVGRGP